MARTQNQSQISPGARLLRRSEVANMLGVHEITLARRVARGDMPPPVRIGSGAQVVWRREDIERYLAELKPMEDFGKNTLKKKRDDQEQQTRSKREDEPKGRQTSKRNWRKRSRRLRR